MSLHNDKSERTDIRAIVSDSGENNPTVKDRQNPHEIHVSSETKFYSVFQSIDGVKIQVIVAVATLAFPPFVDRVCARGSTAYQGIGIGSVRECGHHHLRMTLAQV